MGRPWPPRGPDDLNDARRAQIRREVLGRVRPHGPSAADHAYAVLSVLAAPAPHLVRVIVSLALVTAVVASATVASSDALPDEPLYGVKVASEQVRLALARSPEDRAAVQLSMAEHRLAEAERLALSGREADALIATSAYATHLATAAAELAGIERLEPNGHFVVEQLRGRLEEQQRRAGDVAARLAADPANAQVAPVFETVASAPPPQASGGTTTVAERIAEHAASVSEQLTVVTEQRVQDQQPAASEPPPAAAQRTAQPTVAAAPPAEQPAQPVARATERPAAQPAATQPPAATPSAVGNVAAPDVRVLEQRAQEEQKKLDEAKREAARVEAQKKEALRQAPTSAEFEKVRQHFLKQLEAALAKVKHQRELAQKALEDAKKAAKRTASPKPTRRP